MISPSIKTKALVVNGDDMGINHAHNTGVVNCIEHGIMRTAGIMAPSPWAAEAVKFSKQYGFECGVHLMLSCEYHNYHVGPITRNRKLSRDEKGMCFVENPRELAADLLPDVIDELCAQVEYLQETLGLRLSHLEDHMGCLPIWDGRFTDAAVHLSEKYNLRFHTLGAADFCEVKHLIPVDEYVQVEGSQLDEKKHSFINALEQMQPGLHWYYAHVVDDPVETDAAIGEASDFGASMRYVDFQMLCDEDVKQAVHANDIQLMNASEAIAAFA